MRTQRLLSFSLGAVLLAGCAAPSVSPTPPAATPSSQPTAAPSPAPSAEPTAAPAATPSATPVVEAPFPASAGARFGANDLVAPTYAGFDPQQGLVYVVDVAVPGAGTIRYNLRKFNASGVMIGKNELSTAEIGSQAPTRVDGLAVNQGGLPVVNAIDDNRFTLVKVAGATTVVADRYPVNNIVYARLSGSGVAENGKFISVAVLHRAADSVNTGPEYISMGRAEEGKAPTALYRITDPINTTRLAVANDGRVFLVGPSKEGKLSVVSIKTDSTTDTLPIELPSVPDYVAAGVDGRLYMAWNFGGQPARVRTVDMQGTWSDETELKLATGDYLTHVTGIAFDTNGRAVVTGSGFDAGGKSMKAVFLYSK